jgi:hypothetical protein
MDELEIKCTIQNIRFFYRHISDFNNDYQPRIQ